MIDLVGAEWLKALSFAAVAGAVLTADGAAELESTSGIRDTLSVTGAGAILVLVVGIIISAGEYRHGTAADTFLTTPRRNRVAAAKLTLGAGVGVAAGVVTSLACLGIATLLYKLEGATFPFSDPEVWAILAGALAYTTLFAILGVALGVLIRNQVLAISAALAWIAVIEHTLVTLVPDLGKWLPVAAGQAMVRTNLDDLLSPLAGTAVLAAYAAAIGAVGIRVAATRDA